MDKVDKALLGAAAEHYVMCHLLRRGYVAGLTSRGAPNSDIVVSNRRGDPLFSVQVKSRSQAGPWLLSKAHEDGREALFLACVDFTSDPPDVYVIPSTIVAKVIAHAHCFWRNGPPTRGLTRKDGSMRHLLLDYSRVFQSDNPYPLGWMSPYCNAWHILKGAARSSEGFPSAVEVALGPSA